MRIGIIAWLSCVALTVAADAAPPASDYSALAVRITELEAKVSDLTDRQLIHNVYLRYMRGFDRNDVQLMRSAFWPDCQINYAYQSNTLDEFIKRHLEFHMAKLSSWGHLITNETVDVNGDVAHVETYVTGLFMPKKDESFGRENTIVAGRYIDRLDRRDGEWRISVREFVPYFKIKADADPEAFDPYINATKSACAMGAWDRRDPSYVRPLKRRSDKEIGPPCGE